VHGIDKIHRMNSAAIRWRLTPTSHYVRRGMLGQKLFRFAPYLGPLEGRLVRLVRQLANHSCPIELIEQQAAEAFHEASHYPRAEMLAWSLSLSILEDILAANGTISVHDSSVLVSWPDWTSEAGERGIRAALTRLRRETRQPHLRPSVLEAFGGPWSGADVLAMLSKGARMREAGDEHPQGVRYGDIFSAAAMYWTMPIRDREGRNRRFVITADDKAETPIAILEVGDGPPLATARDALFGLTTPAFTAWLMGHSSPRDVLKRLEARIEAIKSALKPVPGFERFWEGSLYADISHVEAKAAGRSGTTAELTDQKRLAYLGRLTRATEALRILGHGGQPLSKDLYALVRLIKDLSVPRLHLELTICGGLPPFSSALAGKLAVAFCADPRILRICTGPVGGILQTAFDSERLERVLPGYGAILVTTKGLFADHSAQYSNSAIPGTSGRLPMKKIGTTAGVTASLMSRRSFKIAQEYLAATNSKRSVSSAHGSGSSKRQRKIEAAVRELGMPEAIIHPRIPRPIYAVNLVDNPREVALLNEAPRWRVVRSSVDDFAVQAHGLWKRRWLQVASRRLSACEQYESVANWIQREAANVS
jgi:hypothetical protein